MVQIPMWTKNNKRGTHGSNPNVTKKVKFKAKYQVKKLLKEVDKVQMPTDMKIIKVVHMVKITIRPEIIKRGTQYSNPNVTWK